MQRNAMQCNTSYCKTPQVSQAKGVFNLRRVMHTASLSTFMPFA